MNYSLCVNEIFDSIDGEGKKAGQLATFIRLCGCNLRCSYCDTAYAFNEGRHMDIADIIAQVSYPNVTLTGGEPLCQDIHALLEGLKGTASISRLMAAWTSSRISNTTMSGSLSIIRACLRTWPIACCRRTSRSSGLRTS